MILSLWLTSFPESSATTNNLIYPIEENDIYGKNYSEWSAKWWELLQSFPNNINPAADITGERCNDGQTDPDMFFLYGTLGSLFDVKRECTIPSNKSIFIPVLVSECNSLELDPYKDLSERIKCVRAGTIDDGVVTLVVDGRPINSLEDYYTEYSFDSIPLIENNIWNTPPGIAQEYTGGFYVILKPLTPGQHTIEFTGNDPGVFTTKVSYILTITNSTNSIS